jgi:hypothetical protein
VPASAWHRLAAGTGGRERREYDWAWATLPAPVGLPAGFVRTLLARRSVERPAEVVYFLCFHSDALARKDIVRTVDTRPAIAACVRAAKVTCGLDHYQVRKWEGWYRHVTLAMLAYAFVVVTAAPGAGVDADLSGDSPVVRAVRWR